MKLAPALAFFLFISTWIHAATKEQPDWAQFRGPLSNASISNTGAFQGIDSPAFLIRWKQPIGSGYSSVSIRNGRAVTVFSDGTIDWVVAFDQQNGKQLWKQSIGATYKGHDGSHDGPIATPLLHEDAAFVLSPNGVLVAIDANTGTKMWAQNLAKESDALFPYYGYGSSPIAIQGAVVVQHAVKDQFSTVAFDARSGKRIWTAGKDSISYQTPLPAKFAGVEQLLAVGDKFLYGLDPKTGRVLWEYAHDGDEMASGAASMQPLIIDEDRILINFKADQSKLLHVRKEADSWKIETLWANNSLRNTYSRPVYKDGHFYGYSGAFLTCVEASTGKVLWKSRPPGDGFLMLLDGRLVTQTKKGELHLADVSPSGYQEITKLKLFDDYSWTPPSFSNGRIFARSLSEIAGVEIVQQNSATAVAAVALPPGKLGTFLTGLQKAQDRKKAVDAFLSGIDSFPLIDGQHVHFLYRDDAKDVGIIGDMIGARAQEPMTRVEGTDLFYYSTTLDSDARISYRFIRDLEEDLPDPRNPRKEKTARGEMSWVAMPAWREPAFLKPRSDDQRGRIETQEIESKYFKDAKRQIEVYLPPGYDTAREQRHPVVYIHGGKQAREFGELPTALDRLAGSIAEPVIAVFIGQMNEPMTMEYFGESAADYASHLAEEIVPLIDRTYRTIADREHRANAGVSFPGYAALFCTFKHPEIFSRVAAQSPFMLTEDQNLLQKTAADSKSRDVKILLEWSTYDLRAKHEGWDIGTATRLLADFLSQQGYQTVTREVHEGHSWGSFRNRADWVFAGLFPKKK